MRKRIDSDRLKELQFSILCYVDDFCIQNQLNYYLAYGTLLGAVRHKGYIPWDDDIDIMMPREDYELFITYKHVGRYQVLSKYNSGYYLPFAKAIDKKTILAEDVGLDYKMCVNIDVFPIDYLPSDVSALNRLFRRKKFWSKILQNKLLSFSPSLPFYKRTLLSIYRGLFCWIPTSFILNRIDKIVIEGSNCGVHNKCGIIVPSDSKLNEVVDSALFRDKIQVEFEGRYFFAPRGYDAYLTVLYGDYLKLPPVCERNTHHSFIAFELCE